MRGALETAVGHSRAGYTEIRVRRLWRTTVLWRGGAVESVARDCDTGGLVRCCSPGTGWGVVSVPGTDHLEQSVLRAHELALAGASRQPVILAPIAVHQSAEPAPLADDPRAEPLAASRERAESLAAVLHATDRRISSARILCRDTVVETWLATSEGTWLHDLRPEVSVAVLAVAEEEGNVERALGSLAARGGWRAAGGAAELMRSVSARAVERLHAPPVRPGRYPVVLDPAAAGVLVHRAVAHLARPALPGTDPDVLPIGTRIGPALLSVGDDPTATGLRPSADCDDEGTVARRTMIIQNGVVVGHLHSRETAGAARQAPTGHARAGSLSGAPAPRCTNSFLAQGEGALPDLLRGITTGVYVADPLACHVAGGEVALRAGTARMIRGGRLAETVKGVQLEAGILALFGRVDAVGADFAWDGSGSSCEDGAAGPVPVTTGAPHLRLVDVGIGEGIS